MTQPNRITPEQADKHAQSVIAAIADAERKMLPVSHRRIVRATGLDDERLRTTMMIALNRGLIEAEGSIRSDADFGTAKLTDDGWAAAGDRPLWMGRDRA